MESPIHRDQGVVYTPSIMPDIKQRFISSSCVEGLFFYLYFLSLLSNHYRLRHYLSKLASCVNNTDWPLLGNYSVITYEIKGTVDKAIIVVN
jgi:hypothetical protein